MNFIPLHVHSGYSFLRSGLTLERLFKVAKKRGYESIALTDLNVLYGLAGFEKLANKNNIKPLFGMDLVYQGITFSLIAKDETGYLNLIELSCLINQQALNDSLFFSLSAGITVIVSSNQNEIHALLAQGEHQLAKTLSAYCLKIKDFYLGIEINSFNDTAHANYIRDFALKYGYQTVAFPLIKYAEPSDAITLEITSAIANNTELNIKDEPVDGVYYAPTFDEIKNFYSVEEINATKFIADTSNVNIAKNRGTLLKFPLPENTSAKDYLAALTWKGFAKRDLDINNQTYVDRLNYELKMIDQLGFNDYFLIVQDYVAYAKSVGILVGPGRGSAAGSLVSYCLDITQIDPLPDGLLFERFLNPERQTMPDIDIDFSDYRRDEVVEYLREKYGVDRLANITTFQTIGAKQSLRDIGRVYQVNEKNINRLSKTLTDTNYNLRDAYRHLPAFAKLVDEDPYYLKIVSLASKIEGLPRQSGLHAAGIILNNEPLISSLPVKADTSQHLITQYEMDFLEEQGYLKMDLLGLSNLTLIEEIFKSVKTNCDIDLELDTLPYEEPAIYELIASGQTMGLFQLESAGMNQAIKEIKPTNFNDIVAVIALFRPGPMRNISTYAKRKNTNETFSYISPDLEEILAPTYGIIVYQEQIMQIAQKFAGMSLAEADLFRRAISKKDASQLRALKGDFIAGAINLQHSEEIANKVFDAIYEFADYGFNKAHAVGYARLTCQMAYLKLHYPAEFYAAIVGSTSTSNPKFQKYLAEIKARNITLKTPDINLSTDRFSVTNQALIFPLSGIKGLPALSAQAIIDERNKNGKYASFTDFLMRTYQYNLTLLQYERLINAGAFDSLGINRATARENLPKLLTYASIVSVDNNPLRLNLTKTPPPRLIALNDDQSLNLQLEYEALGIMLSGNLLATKKGQIKAQKLQPLSVLENDFYHHNVAAIIMAVKVIKTKKGDQMAFVSVTDGESEIDLTVFPKLFETTYAFLEVNNMIAARVKKDRNRENNYIAETIRLLEDE